MFPFLSKGEISLMMATCYKDLPPPGDHVNVVKRSKVSTVALVDPAPSPTDAYALKI